MVLRLVKQGMKTNEGLGSEETYMQGTAVDAQRSPPRERKGQRMCEACHSRRHHQILPHRVRADAQLQVELRPILR
jgi:hypothetical protein